MSNDEIANRIMDALGVFLQNIDNAHNQKDWPGMVKAVSYIKAVFGEIIEDLRSANDDGKFGELLDSLKTFNDSAGMDHLTVFTDDTYDQFLERVEAGKKRVKEADNWSDQVKEVQATLEYVVLFFG